MPRRTFDAAGFDYNGTLLYDAPRFHEAVCVSIFDRYGKKRPSFDEFREEVGRDPKAMYVARGITAPWETLQEHVTEYFSTQESSQLSPGALSMLRELAHMPKALLTALATPILTKEFRHHRIERYFRIVQSGLLSKTDAILECCQVFGCPPARFVYVGDTPKDIIEAKKAGCFAVAYTKGYADKKALNAEKPDLTVNSWHDFLEEVKFTG